MAYSKAKLCCVLCVCVCVCWGGGGGGKQHSLTYYLANSNAVVHKSDSLYHKKCHSNANLKKRQLEYC
jgi:hypothetical protein